MCVERRRGKTDGHRWGSHFIAALLREDCCCGRKMARLEFEAISPILRTDKLRDKVLPY